MSKVKKYASLFLTMLKIGLFTFGGGYAMIALLENEFVQTSMCTVSVIQRADIQMHSLILWRGHPGI